MNIVNRRKILMPVVLCLAISGCARREAEDQQENPVVDTAHPAVVQEPAPPKEVAAMRIEVALSPAAERQLETAGEKVRVEVTYGGDPAPGASMQPNDMGMIALGGKVLELAGSGTVELAESEVDMSRLDQIVGQPQVMVNTTSTRTRSGQNLLACDFYWDTLSTAGRDGVRIPCKLLNE